MKKLLKTWKKAAFRTVMALLMSVIIVLAPISTVSAVDLPTLSLGDTENFAWDGSSAPLFKITVEESGLYDLNITDNLQTGFVTVVIADSLTNEIVGYVSSLLAEDLVISAFLSANAEYLVAGNYFSLAESNLVPANVTFNLKTSSSVKVLPFCKITDAQALNLTLNTIKDTYLEFTTAEAGDYSLNFDELHAYVSVLDTGTGEKVFSEIDSEYLNEADEWESRGSLVFNLKAQTKYYFALSIYSDSESRFSVTKNEKTVKNIIAIPPNSPISCYEQNIADCFTYEFEYTDSSIDTFDYIDAVNTGSILPELHLSNDEIYTTDYNYLLPGGKQLVLSTYNGETTPIYVEIEALGWHIFNNGQHVTISEYSIQRIDNPNNYEECVLYVNLSVRGATGLYRLYSDSSHGSTWDQFEYIDIEIVDSRNQIVQFDSKTSWPLIALNDYTMIIKYKFNHDEYDDFWFSPGLAADTIFPDTASGQWYSDAVTYAYGAGIMSGYQNGRFGTSDGIQRQDFLVMLGRMEGIYEGAYEGYNPGGFSDFDQNSYYAGAVNWGYENRIVTGYLDGKFGVGDKITREQIVTILYRYAKFKGHNVEVSATSANAIKAKYKDFGSVSEFSEEAILWAIDRGVINGKTSTTIVPQGNAQRCEVAQIMYNIHTKNIF